MKILKILSLTILSIISSSISCFTQQQKVHIYDNNNKYYEIVTKAFDKFNVSYEITNQISTNDQDLYIIFDIQSLDEKQLPQYYITYQTLDLSHNPLTENYLNKLSKSVAVWDYSQHNINRYNSRIHNYYYLPQDYQYADPVILPCFLPTNALPGYRKTLIYDNTSNTDISSHLPTLFCYCILQNPNIILELGVRGGESTKAFFNTLDICNTQLLGIDIEPYPNKLYSTMNNARFFCMNDLDFPQYYINSEYKNQKVDMIFIDTSHLYEHTIQEIRNFVPLLSDNGMLLFHDSNVTPVNGHQYYRLNGTIGGGGYGNTRGVTQALKEYFAIEFNEHTYVNFTFTKNETTWHMTHYPFCNGLTVLKKLASNNI